MDQELLESEQYLLDLLRSELSNIVAATKNPDFLVKLPELDSVEKSPDELATLIARTSNVYAQASRYAGIARANAKLAKGRYERRFKSSKTGKSADEREKSAMEAAHDEHVSMYLAEAVSELSDALESGARIASESIRRIALSNQNYYKASDF